MIVKLISDGSQQRRRALLRRRYLLVFRKIARRVLRGGEPRVKRYLLDNLLALAVISLKLDLEGVMPYLPEIRDDQLSIPAVKLRAAVGEQRLYIRLLAFPAYDLFLNELDGTPAARASKAASRREASAISLPVQASPSGLASGNLAPARGDIPAQLLWNEMRDVAVVIETAQYADSPFCSGFRERALSSGFPNPAIL